MVDSVVKSCDTEVRPQIPKAMTNKKSFTTNDGGNKYGDPTDRHTKSESRQVFGIPVCRKVYMTGAIIDMKRIGTDKQEKVRRLHPLNTPPCFDLHLNGEAFPCQR